MNDEVDMREFGKRTYAASMLLVKLERRVLAAFRMRNIVRAKRDQLRAMNASSGCNDRSWDEVCLEAKKGRSAR